MDRRWTAARSNFPDEQRERSSRCRVSRSSGHDRRHLKSDFHAQFVFTFKTVLNRRPSQVRSRRTIFVVSKIIKNFRFRIGFTTSVNTCVFARSVSTRVTYRCQSRFVTRSYSTRSFRTIRVCFNSSKYNTRPDVCVANCFRVLENNNNALLGPSKCPVRTGLNGARTNIETVLLNRKTRRFLSK